MHTLKIELTGKNSLKVLQELEHKNLIRIVNEPDLNYYSLPGDPLSHEDFNNWVRNAENTPTLGLTEVKNRWAKQKEKLSKPSQSE